MDEAKEEGTEEGGGEVEPVAFGIDEPPTGRAPSKTRASRAKLKEGILGDHPSVLSLTRDELRAQRKVTITIPSTENDKADVTIGINGYIYQVQRDKPVDLPWDVVQVLMSAKSIAYTQRPRTGYGPNGEAPEGMEMVPAEVLRFPFQRSQM